MRALTNSTIASRGVFVKSTFLGDRTTTKTHSRLKPSFRPDVLSKMPRSCNIVFDVLRTMIDRTGQSKASVRDLAQVFFRIRDDSHLACPTPPERGSLN